MNNKKIAILILAILVILGGIALAVSCSKKSDIKTGTQAGLGNILAPPAAADFYEKENTLKVNKGSAIVKKSSGQEETVTSETTVNMGDTIVVSADGTATIYWFDDSVSRLQAGTELTIDKASFNTEKFTETNINFNVIKGNVWSKVKNLIDEDSEFLSYSGSVVAGVRGSVYNIFVADNGEVSVEALQHTAFVGTIDLADKSIKEPKLVTRGKQAKVKDSDIKISEIPKGRLDEEWYKNNIKRDQEDARKIGQKNLNRIVKRAGALPGEAGYDQKAKLIQQKLNEATDAEEKASLNVRVAQLKTNEALALMIKRQGSQNAEKVKDLLDKAKQEIENSGLPKTGQDKLKQQIRVELMAWDRAMEGVLPDNEALYKAKNILRDKQIELVDDSAEQEKLQKKIMERKLYELSDAADMGIDPTRLKKAFESYQKEMESMKDIMVNWSDFQDIIMQTLKRLEGMKGIDKVELQRLMYFFDSGEFQNLIQNLPSEEEIKNMQMQAENELKKLEDAINNASNELVIGDVYNESEDTAPDYFYEPPEDDISDDFYDSALDDIINEYPVDPMEGAVDNTAEPAVNDPSSETADPTDNDVIDPTGSTNDPNDVIYAEPLLFDKTIDLNTIDPSKLKLLEISPTTINTIR